MTIATSLGRPGLLTAEEERELARRRDAGDAGARDELIVRNIPFAINQARKVAPGYAGILEDLEGAAMEGLIRAADEFDPGRGNRFSTYAGYWIRQSLHKWLEDHPRTIRIPRHVFAVLSRRRRELPWEKTGNTAAIVEAAEHAMMFRAAGLTGRDSPDSLLDLAAPEPAAPGDEEHAALRLARLAAALEAIDPRRADVIRARFGIGRDRSSLRELGKVLGVSYERVRQLEADALDQIAGMIGGRA